jgi:hypothetical protein
LKRYMTYKSLLKRSSSALPEPPALLTKPKQVNQLRLYGRVKDIFSLVSWPPHWLTLANAAWLLTIVLWQIYMHQWVPETQEQNKAVKCKPPSSWVHKPLTHMSHFPFSFVLSALLPGSAENCSLPSLWARWVPNSFLSLFRLYWENCSLPSLWASNKKLLCLVLEISRLLARPLVPFHDSSSEGHSQSLH